MIIFSSIGGDGRPRITSPGCRIYLVSKDLYALSGRECCLEVVVKISLPRIWSSHRRDIDALVRRVSDITEDAKALWWEVNRRRSQVRM